MHLIILGQKEENILDEIKNKVEDDVFTADSVAHGSSSVGAAMNRVKSCLNYSLKQKYGIEDDNISETILRVHGLSKKNLEFINNFESLVESKAEIHSDESEETNIDQNANKSDVSVSGILVENSAPIAKLLGYRYLYRKMVEMYGKQRAKFLCGEMYDYSLALADSTNVLKPYSYYSNTPIYIKTNEKESFITLKDLFDKYSNFSHYDSENNMEVIYTEDLKRSVLFHKTFMYNSKDHIQTYDEDSQFNGEKLVSEKVNIKVWDDKNGFVDVTRIIRHKPDVDMILYQTEDGDFSFVTEDHPVILEDMTEKTARDLVIGDKIKKAEFHIVPTEKETVDVPEKLAYFLGFMLGDGSLKGFEQDQDYIDSPNGCIKFLRGNSIITVFQENIEESRILKIAKELFPESNFWSFTSSSDKIRSFSNWTLSSICSYYFGYNISENSFTKHLPNNIMSWKKESILAFAAGLVDADGTVFKQNGRCLIRVMSTAIIQELYDALIYCGVRAQKHVSGSSRDDMVFSISFNPNETIYKWCEKLWSLDKEKCLNPSIKNDKVVRSNKINKIFKISRDKTTSPKPNSFLFDELEYVYDITTSTGHFVSGNMVQHNCFSTNMSRLVLEGRPFGKLHSLPPHRISSYIACLNETVHQLSNHTAGALAIATLFLDCARVMIFEERKSLFRLKHSKKYRKYVKNCFQNFIHSMNHLSRNSTESPFTNVSIFDKPKLRDLLNDDNFAWYFDIDKKPRDAKLTRKTKGKNWTEYCVSIISEMQDIFMDIMDAGDVARNGLPITFPVTTLNISIDDNREVVDPEFVKKICKHDVFRYNIFVSQGNKIASCCFTGDQMLSYFNEEGVLCYKTFKEYVEQFVDGLGEQHLENSKDYIIDPESGEMAPITGVICMKNDWQKIITIELKNGEVIKATPNQKFYDKISCTFVAASEIYDNPEKYDI